MTVERQIAALLAKAEPLRCLSDDEPEKVPLAAIVDRINALRAVQATEPMRLPPLPDIDPEAPVILPDPMTDPLPSRRPGRPRRVAA